MTHLYSIPIDDLIQPKVEAGPIPPSGLVVDTPDILIVGSGYGASIAARKLSGLRRPDGTAVEVTVLERGDEYAVGEFPTTLGELPGHVRIRRPSDSQPIGYAHALFDVRAGEDLDILVGNGLGGGSLINANVAARPLQTVLDDPRWPAKYRGAGLKAAFEAVEAALGVSDAPVSGTRYAAFDKLVNALPLGTAASAAGVTVTLGPHPNTNSAGIQQPICTRCGNCVTGCNVGAKNTLMMNLIPLAKERGARFVTGANVLSVAALPPDPGGGPRWRVSLQRTRAIGTPLESERFYVDARYVILAAGALGSTEIMLRSAALPEALPLSAMLGLGFSTNGDGIAFSFGQTAQVGALGTADIQAGHGPGPTISGIVQGELDGGSQPFTLENAAVPAAIVKAFGEALVTGAQLHRIGDNRLPGWFGEPLAHDPLAYNPQLLEHAQVLLMMTDDGASRSLRLRGPEGAGPAGQCAFPSALAGPGASAAANRGLTLLDELLSEENLEAGLDGGQYVPNPLWKLLPDEAAGALGGKLPEPRGLSVHPLGGCRMAESSATGVVNPDGVVFDGAGNLHHGLYVMDGSVIPRPLATNPFLTIGALAWACCDTLRARLAADENWTEAAGAPALVAAPAPGLLPATPIHPVVSPPPRLVLREQLLGKLLISDPDAADRIEQILPGGKRFLGKDGMVLRLETAPVDVHSKFAPMSGGPIRIDATVALYLNPEGAVLSRNRARYGAPRALRHQEPVATGTASVTILELDDPPGERCTRALAAIAAFAERRGLSSPSQNWIAHPIAALEGIWKTALMHASYRQFDYEVALQIPGGGTIDLHGRKEVRWAIGAERLWDSLLHLPVDEMRFQKNGVELTAPADFVLDAGYLLDEGLIQVADGGDLAESIATALSFVAWFARCLLQTGFWEFAAPRYPELPLPRELDPPNLQQHVAPISYPLTVPTVPVSSPNAQTLPLELTRYPKEGAPPVLLIHGLAQGSGIFTSPHVGTNLATYLWEEGHDVWLLDYRLSNRFDAAQVPYGGWAIDAIGLVDVPEAVRKVYEATGRKVRIFAHCVGAIGVQIALLTGRLRDAHQVERVESVCFNAIHPWIVPAAANLARSKLGAFARAWISEDLLDPILETQDQLTGLQSLVDRIGSSLARIGEDTQAGGEGHGPPTKTSRGICDRMTLLYGRMWRHENLRSALEDHWEDLVGRAPIEVYQQLYYLIDRERILNDEGRNVYLTEPNIRANWGSIPTLFLHGDESDVFNPQSATRSAFRLDKALREFEAADASLQLAPVYLKRIPGYGHMDPILAKHAHERSYPVIAAFFEAGAAWQQDRTHRPALFDPIREADDPDWNARKELETGQVLRAAWIDGGQIVQRWWGERFEYNTSPPTGVVIESRSGTLTAVPNADLIFVDADEQSYVWVDERTNPAGSGPSAVRGEAGGVNLWILDREIRTALPPKVRQLLVRMEETGFMPGPRPLLESDQLPYYRRLIRKLNGEPGAADSFHFVVGSCRYPGTPVEAEQADAIFAGMRALLAQTELDLAFFVGDQIYADAYNDVFDNGVWRDRFKVSYRVAFNSPNMKEVLRSLPIHFAIDDHEIVDDWSGGTDPGSSPPRGSGGPQELTYAGLGQDQLDFARQAARHYTSSARDQRAVGAATQPAAGALWYALDHVNEVNFPCFVLDTRGERTLREVALHGASATLPPMLSPDGQLAAFLEWLSAAQTDMPDRPKFVFAGQILAPIARDLVAHPSAFRFSDGFFGYPGTLRAVIEHIVAEQIRSVVFVGGDLHLSCAAELTLRANGQEVGAWQIVASGLYAPARFANSPATRFAWASPETVPLVPGDTVSLTCTSRLLTTSVAHFVQVRVGRSAENWRIAVSAHGKDGAPIPAEQSFSKLRDKVEVVFT